MMENYFADDIGTQKCECFPFFEHCIFTYEVMLTEVKNWPPSCKKGNINFRTDLKAFWAGFYSERLF